MALLFRLPFMLIELLLRRLLGRGEDDKVYAVTPDPPPTPAATPTPAPTPARGRGPASAFTGANGAPPPSAEEAIARRFEREAADAASAGAESDDVAPPTPLRPLADDHVDTEATVVESFGPSDDVGGTVVVEEPWPGYDRDSASAIVARLRDADAATKGVVGLYETANKGRKTVLKAVG